MTVPALRVDAAGMCCALGYSTDAASAAIRACMDHFRESWFVGEGGKPLYCAMIWDVDYWGPERMALMFDTVFNECLTQCPKLDPAETCLMLLVPEPRRPGGNADWPQYIFSKCTEARTFHASSQICPWGRAGLGPSLIYARNILEQGTVRQVLLAGVDSYLAAGTIDAFLARERLLTGDISDGFVPGEGAGAVILRLEEPGWDGLHITGVGAAQEPAHINQDQLPNRGDGLTIALRNAAEESGRPLTGTHFHMSDCNGNTFYLKEEALALARALEDVVHRYPHLLLAPYIGETGAAVGPLMLAYLTRLLPRDDGFGTRALLHFSGDDGERSAVVVEYRH